MAAASAGHSIECLPHWFLGHPERLAGWLLSLHKMHKLVSTSCLSALPACQHFPLGSALLACPTALWPGPWPVLAPVVPVTTCTYLLLLGQWEGTSVRGQCSWRPPSCYFWAVWLGQVPQLL